MRSALSNIYPDLPLTFVFGAMRDKAIPEIADILFPLAEQVMYPTAERLLEQCAAVLRLPGESTGADQDVAIARRRGIPVFTELDEIPGPDEWPA